MSTSRETLKTCNQPSVVKSDLELLSNLEQFGAPPRASERPRDDVRELNFGVSYLQFGASRLQFGARHLQLGAKDDEQIGET